MKPDEAVNAVYNGELVEIDAESWSEVRTALQRAAGRWIDGGDHVRAMIALNEVKRCDALWLPQP